MGSVKVCWNL